jgi:hypothetical protein
MRQTFSNTVLTINSKDIESIKEKLEVNDKIFVVELDGTNIQSWRKFRFPTPCFDSYDRYLDWMRDLEWLNRDEFVLIINYFSVFLKDDPELRNQIISDFVEVILPFCQDEIKKVVVEGKAKPFVVYLVD